MHIAKFWCYWCKSCSVFLLCLWNTVLRERNNLLFLLEKWLAHRLDNIAVILLKCKFLGECETFYTSHVWRRGHFSKIVSDWKSLLSDTVISFCDWLLQSDCDSVNWRLVLSWERKNWTQVCATV